MKIKNLQQKFEQLINIDFEGLDEEIRLAKDSFQAAKETRNYNSLGYGIKTEVKDWSSSLFAQTSLFFEVGLYLKRENKNSSWKVMYSFSYGQFAKEDQILNMSLPNSTLEQIFKKTEIQGFENLNCSKWIDQKKFQAFMIPIQQDVAFIAFTGLAEPWLKIHLEKIQQRLLQIEP